MGLKFGLWVELEMVNKDSDLYRAHPDWLIGVPGRFESHARHQHVLDFSRKEVVDAIYDMIAKIISESSISYIKWDMNRYMTEPYSRGMSPEHQGEIIHRYILGVYDLYNRLTSRFPQILFESCASGGPALTQVCCTLRHRPGPAMIRMPMRGPRYSTEPPMFIRW